MQINTPQIRFKGFTEPWEIRKLGEIGTCQSGIGFPEAEQGGQEGIPFFKVSDMNIDGNENELRHSNNYVTQEQIERKKWKPITEVPAIFFAKVGAAVMLNRKRLVKTPFLLDNNTMAYKFSDGWNANFGKALFDTIDLTALVQVGALPSYNAGDVENIEIPIPNSAEQQKIGELFGNFDNLINLYGRKCESLKKIKKAMLYKMFPQNGESTPQIRFKGFTEPWEIRKCKELCDITTGKSNTQDQSANGIYPFFIRSDTPAKSNRYLYDDEAVITIGDGNIGRVFHYINGKYDLHQRCYKMSNFRELIAKYFYYYFSANFYKRAMTMTAKATVDSVRLDMIAEMDIMYPNSKKEQTKIGEYFANLDRLIMLHDKKIQKLKSIKTALLNKAFAK